MSIQMAGPWITEHEEKIVLDALKHGWYGEKAYHYCETFETEFAQFHDRKYALMTPNCTTAIHLLLAGLGIGEGDEVIVPECTWIASAAPITYQRATTIFADIDPDHWCLTPESLERVITHRTRAAIVVDLYGNMPEWDGLREVAERHDVILIEDSAEALGSIYKGIRAGKFGVGSVFSFHRTKTITTGEGGMLLLDDDKLFRRCKILRDHGRGPGDYSNVEVAFKYMPFNMQAALGYAQFQRLNELVERKRWIWQSYKDKMSDVPDIYLNPEPEHVYNGVWCTALMFGESHGMTKEKAMKELGALGLPTRPFFYPLSSLKAYPGREEAGRHANPIAYDVSARAINLPSALNIIQEQIDEVSKGLHSLLGYSD
ncbi:MAG: DegT/DnrJ/EryC1/StrS aminotransferase family protein [Rhodothermia bacterium]|nr:MAG: DegT/DnrJ/EryC1/StrS aminotransferase family protein [Rhodothermia bacterium]